MGMLIYIGDALISWSSRKQSTLICFSIEVEYLAIASTVEELEVVRSSLTELGITVTSDEASK